MNRVCYYCGVKSSDSKNVSFQRDHFKPKAAGGTDHPSNIFIVCSDCNGLKKDKQFHTVEDCRLWLHWFLYRKSHRLSRHRDMAHAFNGKPPTDYNRVIGSLLHSTATSIAQWRNKMNEPALNDPNLEWGSI